MNQKWISHAGSVHLVTVLHVGKTQGCYLEDNEPRLFYDVKAIFETQTEALAHAMNFVMQQMSIAQNAMSKLQKIMVEMNCPKVKGDT
jgi:hypothetical protein